MTQPIRPGIRTGDSESREDNEHRLRDALREAAAAWPAGVAVVAARDGALFEAVTVTSLLTVSLEPPTILVSIGRQAAIVPLLDAAGRFTVSLLAADQRRTAAMIADRMPGVRSMFSDSGVLADARQALSCATERIESVGDHRLYIARVEAVTPGRDAPPLLYYQRRYRGLADG